MSVSINYHREGSGPPLVLLHGVGHHWQAWQPVIDLLAGEFDVIACDSPGFGRSAPLSPGIEPTIPAYVDAFELFLAELGLDRPHVAGCSMGGGIALELARNRAVASAAAFCPVGFWSAAEARYCQLVLGSLARMPRALHAPTLALARTRPGRRALLRTLYGFPAQVPTEEAVSAFEDAWAAPALTRTLQCLPRYRFAPMGRPRGVPVTVAWGVRDRLLPHARQAPRARASLPWATHVALGAGHVPFSDDPGAVAEVIRSCARSAQPAVLAAD